MMPRPARSTTAMGCGSSSQGLRNLACRCTSIAPLCLILNGVTASIANSTCTPGLSNGPATAEHCAAQQPRPHCCCKSISYSSSRRHARGRAHDRRRGPGVRQRRARPARLGQDARPDRQRKTHAGLLEGDAARHQIARGVRGVDREDRRPRGLAQPRRRRPQLRLVFAGGQGQARDTGAGPVQARPGPLRLQLPARRELRLADGLLRRRRRQVRGAVRARLVLAGAAAGHQRGAGRCLFGPGARPGPRGAQGLRLVVERQELGRVHGQGRRALRSRLAGLVGPRQVRPRSEVGLSVYRQRLRRRGGVASMASRRERHNSPVDVHTGPSSPTRRKPPPRPSSTRTTRARPRNSCTRSRRRCSSRSARPPKARARARRS